MLPSDATADQALPTTPAGRARDAESTAWITALAGEGSRREEARDRLRALLLRAARSELARSTRADGDESRDPLEELAIRAADRALTAIERDLRAYGGRTRFTTWAAKFALYEAAVQLRLHAWRDRPLPAESDGLALLLHAQCGDDTGAETAAQLGRVRVLLAARLTDHQRSVVVALALSQVPIDVLAERLATTRGALYETLHEARLAIRRGLSEPSPDG